MLKQDHKEKNSNDLLTDLTERTGLTFDEDRAHDERFELEGETAATALTAQDEADEAADGEPEIHPLDVRVFGLPRMQFWGVAGGIGLGYVVYGFLGMVIDASFSVWWPAIACSVAGYFITGRIHKKQVAARDAAAQENP